MAYSDFKDLESLQPLGVSVRETTVDVVYFAAVQPSPFLTEALRRFVPLAAAINTEKARSEYIVAPILSELTTRSDRVSLFSGRNFNVDAERGLTGFCDFILTQNPDKLLIKSPIAIIVEAKNENINAGLAPCIAAMVGAYEQNQQENSARSVVYGAVTTGQVWRFLRLEQTTVVIGLNDRYLTPLDQPLGILTAIVESED